MGLISPILPTSMIAETIEQELQNRYPALNVNTVKYISQLTMVHAVIYVGVQRTLIGNIEFHGGHAIFGAPIGSIKHFYDHPNFPDSLYDEVIPIIKNALVAHG